MDTLLRIAWFLTVLMIRAGSGSAQSEPARNEPQSTLKITSPKDGALVQAGETVLVKAQVLGDRNARDFLLSCPAGVFETEVSPAEFEIKIPEAHPLGPTFPIAVAGRLPSSTDERGFEIIGDYIALEVVAPAELISIEVHPNIMFLGPYSEEDGSFFNRSGLTVSGWFADGKRRNITLASKTGYVSQNENVAVVAREKGFGGEEFVWVQGISQDTTSITVSYGTRSIVVPVEVGYQRPFAMTLQPQYTSDHPRVKVGTTLLLDGSGSHDVYDRPLLFKWTLRFRPPGSEARIVYADNVVARITPDQPGPYMYQLVIDDIWRDEFDREFPESSFLAVP